MSDKHLPAQKPAVCKRCVKRCVIKPTKQPCTRQSSDNLSPKSTHMSISKLVSTYLYFYLLQSRAYCMSAYLSCVF